MLPDKKIKCPYTAFKMSCFDGVSKHSCPKWIHLTGSHPNTGQPVDTFDCADRWMPALLVADTQQGRQMGAAVESLRNVVAEVNGYVEVPQMKLTAG